MIAPVTIEFREEAPGPHDGRWASLKIAGVEVFTEFVYDRDGDGNRTEEQAAKNLLSVFRRRLEDA